MPVCLRPSSILFLPPSILLPLHAHSPLHLPFALRSDIALHSDIAQLDRPRVVVLDTTFAHHSWNFEPQVRLSFFLEHCINMMVTVLHGSHVLPQHWQIVWAMLRSQLSLPLTCKKRTISLASALLLTPCTCSDMSS